ncbi:MAG: peptide chain release factor 1, partial [Candidatus Micrarchaeota archaeon]
GPGPSKEDFSKQKPFNYQLKVLGVVDTGYTDEYGLREILEKSGDIIAEQESIVEKKILDEFIREISSEGLAAYGLEAAEKAVDSKQASKLLISEEMELKKIKYKCSACGKELERLEERAADNTTGIPCECGGHYKIMEMQDVINDLVGKAEEQGIPVVMISKDTAEGRQFYGTFKGIGVFLRYKL